MITLSNKQPQHSDYSHWRELGLFEKMTDFRFGTENVQGKSRVSCRGRSYSGTKE